MENLKILIMLYAITLLLNSCNSIFVKKTEIIYQAKNGDVVDVFNITDSIVSHEDSEYLKRRDHRYGDLGGEIEFCSNAEYFCLHGGVSVVIPKSEISQQSWSFLDMNCQTSSHFSGLENIDITCTRNKYSTTFTYSRDRGIISYTFSWDTERMYELVGAKGLFANPSGDSKSRPQSPAR